MTHSLYILLGMKAGRAAWMTAAVAGVVWAQQAKPPVLPGQPPAPGVPAQAAAAPTAVDQLRPSYVLGPNDQIQIRAFEVEEINEKLFRIDEDGTVTLPLLGKLKVGGTTVQEFEADLVNRLRTYVRNPQVIVNITQFRSEPVFFVGAFVKPGIYPLQGRRTLVEMLSSVGGMQPNASRRIRLQRRKEYGLIPLPNAVQSADGKTSSVEISMGSLREQVNPAEDVVLQPYDMITVERAEMIYVSGEVNRTGAFELGERESLSILQVLTIAGGLGPNASPNKARILRPVLNTSRRAEIPIDLKKVLAGQANDYPLMPNDVLYVPRTLSKRRVFTAILPYMLALVPTLIYVAVR